MNIDRGHFSGDDSPMSNSTPHSEDDKHSEEFQSSPPPQQYLEESSRDSPSHEHSVLYAQQQHELFARLREQLASFPFNQRPNFAGQNLLEQHQAQQQLQQQQARPEAHSRRPHDFPFSFPTPPPSKGEDDVKISSTSSTTSKRSSQNSSSWSYEDQFKQVRQLYEINADPKRKEFLDDLFMFMKDRGTPINRLPIMAKSVLDLYELYKLVIGRGGLVNVINKKLWQEIIKDLNLPSSITSAAFTLRTQYTKYLYPYECEKYNLSTDSELQAAIENNKRDGSRRSTSSSYSNQFSQQQLQPQLQPLQPPQPTPEQLLALAQMLNAANVGINLRNAGAIANEVQGIANEQIEPPENKSLEQIQEAHQRFLFMVAIYNKYLHEQMPST